MPLDRCSKYGDPGLWIRSAYLEDFVFRGITAVVRAGDRISTPDFKTLQLGVDYPVRFIKKPGDGFDKPAVLYPDDGTTVRITERFAKKIGALTAEDLAGCAPDQATSELVRYHLALVNNTELPLPDEMVTVWRFAYRPNATE
ncbi:MAG: hypothetical protein AAB919_00615 [Patescibacteria group bacterium]